jgi:gelsolin
MATHDGLIHLKQYDIKDSNVELMGTHLDHLIKYNSAATEPARNNGVTGNFAGLYIWRIEVVAWPTNQTGEFYEGGSYIVLHSYKVVDKHDTQLFHEIFSLSKACKKRLGQRPIRQLSLMSSCGVWRLNTERRSKRHPVTS